MIGNSLPKGWCLVKFGDLVRKVNNRVDPESSGISRYVAGEHMDSDNLNITRWGTVGDGYLGPAFTMRFQPGQVLYGSRRTYLRKVALANFEGVCANTTFVLETKSDDLLQAFLPHVMSTERFHAHSISKSKGSVNPYINFVDLNDYEFALPPVAEQRRIIELISALDEAISSYGAMDFVLLTKSVIKDFDSSAGIDWSESTLGDIAEFINGYPFKPADLGKHGLPVVRIKQLLDPSEAMDCALIQVPDKYLINDGDIVFSWSATLAVRQWDRGQAVLNQHLFRVVEKAGVLHAWLPIVLDNAIGDLLQKSHGTTMKHITKQTLLPHRVLLPPIEVQRQIVNVVEQIKIMASKCEKSFLDLQKLRISLINEMPSMAIEYV
jgi:type I restriction enzyme, S subunit